MEQERKAKLIQEGIEVAALVVLTLGLTAAGFYAKEHGIDDSYFFIGALISFIAVIRRLW